MLKTSMIALALMTGFAGSALAEMASPTEPPKGNYQQVSKLVKLPSFLPGMGALYVNPKTLPAGPFAAYGRDGKLVSTIYMIPIKDMQAKKKFSGLGVAGEKVHSVDFYYNAGHPGVSKPHYHVVLWHTDPKTAKVK